MPKWHQLLDNEEPNFVKNRVRKVREDREPPRRKTYQNEARRIKNERYGFSNED